MGKLFVGAALMLLMLCRPEAAANGAREGLRQWYYVVAPSLYPFMALMPLMTCPEANDLYDRMLGKVMRRAFGLPGSAASPMIVGMIADPPRAASQPGAWRGRRDTPGVSWSASRSPAAGCPPLFSSPPSAQACWGMWLRAMCCCAPR